MPKEKYKPRKDGRYATTFRGKPVYARTSKELEEKIEELNYLYKTGLVFDNNNLTFKDYSSKWLELQQKINPNKSYERETRLLKKYIIPEIGLIQLKSLKKTSILQLQADMISKDLKESTNRAIALVKNILNSAIDDNLIMKNVADNIKGKVFEKEERKPLTKEEDSLLLEVAQTHKHGLFFLFMRYCGLRPEEVRALNTYDINLEEQTVYIYDAVSFSVNRQGVKKDTKNLVHRKVPILDFMIPLVKEAIENARLKKTTLLFYKQTDPKQHMSQSAYKSCVNSFLVAINQFKKAKEENENSEHKEFVPINFVPYQLRHSYCTMLYYAGIGIKEAQDLMGDKNSKMILDVYTHLQKENENSLEKLNNYFNSVVKQ